MQLQPNFTLQELRSRCGRTPSVTQMRNIRVLAWVLQRIRNQQRKPIVVRSGWRSAEHNRAIKGHPASYHVDGLACDFTCTGITPKHLGESVHNMQLLGIIPEGLVIVYPTFVHYQLCGRREIIYK